jgi:dipeptidyl aminopeptidase/acylaminoacyl peptidase
MPAPGASEPATLAPVPGAAIKPSRSVWLAAAAVLAAMIVVAAFFIPRSPRVSDNEAPLTAVPFTSYPGQETTPSVSPDGSRIAFSWDQGTSSGAPAYDLYVKAIGSETLLRLTNHPSEWISSAWSPDGTQIAFHRIAGADTGIYIIPALGGPERKPARYARSLQSCGAAQLVPRWEMDCIC